MFGTKPLFPMTGHSTRLMALQRGATSRALPGIEHAFVYTHEGRFEANEKNGKIRGNRAKWIIHSMAILA